MRYFALLLLAAALAAAATPADQMRDRARKAEKSGDILEAYLLYAQAAGMDPSDKSSWAKAQSLKPRAMMRRSEPLPPGLDGAAADPAAPTKEDLDKAGSFLAPLRLEATAGTRTFDLRGDTKAVCEQVLRLFGIEAIFDADLQPKQNVRFRMENVGFQEAGEALQLATGTFLVPVSEKLALVATDNQQKRQELEHTIAVSIPLPTAMSVQEAQELARSVQAMMEVQKFGVDPNQRVAVIRDRESKVLPAIILFRDLLRYRAQVMVELELLETTDTSSLDVGLQLPTRFPLQRLAEVFNSKPSVAAGNYLVFGGGASFLGIGLANSQIFGTWAQNAARSLNRAQLRGNDGQPIQFHLGDKYPVMTTGYFGATDTSGQAFTPPPTFNFEDLGVALKITPHVHTESEVTLEIEAEYKLLTGEALNGIPVISNRKFATSARLKMGETAVIAGLMRASEARSLTGIAGLMQIPVIGHLFRQDSRQRESGQALLVIKPQAINVPGGDFTTRTVLTGTEGRPRIPL